MLNQMEQIELRRRAAKRGGWRKGAGRKPAGVKAGAPHTRRQRIERLLPVHVTVRMARHVYNLRSQRAFSIIGRALAAAADRFGVRIIEFSVQANHMHLVVEAAAHEALSRAMQGFLIRVAKGLNRMMNRAGRVLADRYYAHILETPTETRWAVLYVRRNYHKHMEKLGKPVANSYVDPFASPGAAIELALPRNWVLRRATAPP